MRQLSAQDALFVYLETPHTPMHIGSVAIYDPSTAAGGFVRFKDILSYFENRLSAARSFRQRLVRVPFDLDHPYWIEDPAFDLEFHVRHIALPKPGDWRQLCIQAARLLSRPMDLAKPLWEFTVIEGLDNIDGLPPGCFAIVSKVHHAAVDGVSGVEISSAVHSLSPEIEPSNAEDTWLPENMPHMIELIMRSYFNGIAQPMRMVETIGRSLPGMRQLATQIHSGDISLRNQRAAPKTRFNGKVSAHRVWDAAPFPLNDIRRIKDAIPGATVNDVVLTIVGGALREYLQGKSELPVESMTSMVPISTRQSDENGDLGNQISAMVVSLGTQIADPLERLRFVYMETTNSKALTNAVGAKNLASYSQLMPSALSGLGARLYTRLGIANQHDPVFNCVVTNVPGPRVPLYFCGAKMVATYGFGPVFDGVGLIHPVYSYGDTIAIAFTADRDIMPDPQLYTAALRDSFEKLVAATRQEAVPRSKHSSAPSSKPRKTTPAKRRTAR